MVAGSSVWHSTGSGCPLERPDGTAFLEDEPARASRERSGGWGGSSALAHSQAFIHMEMAGEKKGVVLPGVKPPFSLGWEDNRQGRRIAWCLSPSIQAREWNRRRWGSGTDSSSCQIPLVNSSVFFFPSCFSLSLVGYAMKEPGFIWPWSGLGGTTVWRGLLGCEVFTRYFGEGLVWWVGISGSEKAGV